MHVLAHSLIPKTSLAWDGLYVCVGWWVGGGGGGGMQSSIIIVESISVATTPILYSHPQFEQ